MANMRRKEAKSPNEKMRAYRARLRAAGLRPVQIWVPDTRAEDFAEEARRQSLLVRDRASERQALDFIEAVSQGMDE